MAASCVAQGAAELKRTVGVEVCGRPELNRFTANGQNAVSITQGDAVTFDWSFNEDVSILTGSQVPGSSFSPSIETSRPYSFTPAWPAGVNVITYTLNAGNHCSGRPGHPWSTRHVLIMGCPGYEYATPTFGGGVCGFACNGGYKKCSDRRCIPEATCCNSSDCVRSYATGECSGEGGSCSFTCNPGYKDCNGTCIPNSSCCSSADCRRENASGSCSGAGGSCSFACDRGYKPCGDACIPNASCCSNWDCARSNAAGTCSGAGGSCSFVCESGYKDCGGTCVPNGSCCVNSDCTRSNASGACSGAGGSCSFACNGGYLDCGGICTSCSRANAAGSCSGAAGSCSFACNSGYKDCNGTCIPNGSCCSSPDCTRANANGTCSGAGGSCRFACADGYKDCGGTCIPNANCCADSDCTRANATGSCSGPGGSCSFACNPGNHLSGDSCVANSPIAGKTCDFGGFNSQSGGESYSFIGREDGTVTSQFYVGLYQNLGGCQPGAWRPGEYWYCYKRVDLQWRTGQARSPGERSEWGANYFYQGSLNPGESVKDVWYDENYGNFIFTIATPPIIGEGYFTDNEPYAVWSRRLFYLNHEGGSQEISWRDGVDENWNVYWRSYVPGPGCTWR
ncbi:MAG: hypothetical protein HY554_09735 [Elusimicrobia bacterium]|nr:hypothetical protein [Elusimicrobiota bacterium]